VYVVRLDPSVDRSRVMEHLAARGVASRPYFSPLHLQPVYQSAFGYRPGDFPVTERVAATTVALPFSPLLPDEDVATVAEVLIEAVEG
jgi:perosamine synthetase